MNAKRIKHIVLFTGVVAAGLAAYAGLRWYTDCRMHNFVKEGSLYLRSGDGLEEVAERIGAECGVRNAGSLARCLRKEHFELRKRPGHYVIKPEHSSIYVARMLTRGWQSPVMLTISGTVRKPSDLAVRISAQMMADSASLAGYIKDSIGGRLFCDVIPDSYQMWWTATPGEIFARLRKEADSFWTEDNIRKAAALGLDRRKAVTLASIVNSETNHAPEMPLVAGVYLNRLARGMKLQADPTVAWCYGFKVNRITRKMLNCDSPYNTYRYAGLPPGPIALPSRKALSATLNPDFGNSLQKAGGRGCNLYFCADPSFNGTHRFTDNYAAHTKNARAFRNALDKVSKK